jgi:DNA-binding CsgD family transcriptional regulator
VAAAQTCVQAGAFDKALGLLVTAEAGPLDELQSAQVDLLRGQIAFASGMGSDAPPLLLKAAARLQSLDLDLARETYLSAWGAAVMAGHLVDAGDLREVSRAARAAPAPARPPRSTDLLLDGLALAVTDGLAAAAPALRQAVTAFTSADTPVEERLRWSWLAPMAAEYLWEIGMEGFAERTRRELQATGETARKRTAQPAVEASRELTSQEAQVARLVGDGLSNPEIGARLFISSHTVQYHLSKVFAKLGITSRGQLHQVLAGGPDTPAS